VSRPRTEETAVSDTPLPLPFCIAPWVHAYRGTDGFRSLCCLATTIKGDHESFDDWWNSETLKDIRRRLLNGEVPAACDPCVQSNRASGEGYNALFNQRYASELPAIMQGTSEDGATTVRPRSIDYRTIHCNLKCRTCDARNSSSIYAEAAKHGDWLPPRAVSILDERTIEPEVLAQVNHIYWAGGEPFMSPAHQPAMDALIASGRAGQVHVHYTSNLMHWNARIAELMNRYSSAFGSMVLGASIDGVGEIGAYVRHGWDDTRFFENLVELRIAAPLLDIYLDVTLTNIGLLGLPELLLRCDRQHLKVSFKLMECNNDNDFLDVCLLTEEAWRSVIARCRALKVQRYYLQRVDEIEGMLRRRYRPAVMDEPRWEMLRRSEERRGAAGFWKERMANLLHVTT